MKLLRVLKQRSSKSYSDFEDAASAFMDRAEGSIAAPWPFRGICPTWGLESRNLAVILSWSYFKDQGSTWKWQQASPTVWEAPSTLQVGQMPLNARSTVIDVAPPASNFLGHSLFGEMALICSLW